MKRLPLSVLLLALLPAWPHSPALAATPAPALSAGALVDSVAAHYARLSAFQFAGCVRVTIRGASLPGPFNLEVPFSYALRMPSRLRVVLQSPQVSTMMVADGDTLWMWMPTLHQLMTEPAPRLTPGVRPPGQVGQALNPVLQFADLDSHDGQIGELARDTVLTDAGPVTCRRLVLATIADSAHAEAIPSRHVLWVDEARRLVLRDSLSMELDRPGQGHIFSTQDSRFVHADDVNSGPDSLYAFHVPAGAQRVDRFGAGAPPTPPAPPDLAGKPAKPFTLTGTDGVRVSLAAQRGRVVVLDFWATWCGPCRRWMPIVAGLEQKLRGHGVRFWAVNVHEPTATVKAFVAESKLAVPVLLDPDGRVSDAYGASSIPLTVVIGRDGTVVQVLLGLHTEAELRAALRKAGVQGA